MSDSSKAAFAVSYLYNILLADHCNEVVPPARNQIGEQNMFSFCLQKLSIYRGSPLDFSCTNNFMTIYQPLPYFSKTFIFPLKGEPTVETSLQQALTPSRCFVQVVNKERTF